MQKTEKHCKNQCFCYHKTTKISPKTGPKTQKSASGPGHLRNRKKRCCKPKNWGQKVEKHGVFFTFHLPILDGRVHEQVSSVLFFYSVFWRRASRPIKNRRFWTKNAPPPPGKPVTFLRVPSGRSRPSTFGAGGFGYIYIYIYFFLHVSHVRRYAMVVLPSHAFKSIIQIFQDGPGKVSLDFPTGDYPLAN